MHRTSGCLAGLVAAALAGGCAKTAGPTASAPGPAAKLNRTAFLLKEEPAGAMTVNTARADCKDGDAVVVVGRIGGDKKPWIDGRAGFWIVDASLKSCDQNDENCETPWDYCHMPKEELRRHVATVKVVDDKGATVPVDARELLGIKELQTVVVRGKAKRDEQGNLTVLASGVYPRP
jgi:hypothetical protein